MLSILGSKNHFVFGLVYLHSSIIRNNGDSEEVYEEPNTCDILMGSKETPKGERISSNSDYHHNPCHSQICCSQ